jgi:hypothetical protein
MKFEVLIDDGDTYRRDVGWAKDGYPSQRSMFMTILVVGITNA